MKLTREILDQLLVEHHAYESDYGRRGGSRDFKAEERMDRVRNWLQNAETDESQAGLDALEALNFPVSEAQAAHELVRDAIEPTMVDQTQHNYTPITRARLEAVVNSLLAVIKTASQATVALTATSEISPTLKYKRTMLITANTVTDFNEKLNHQVLTDAPDDIQYGVSSVETHMGARTTHGALLIWYER